mmetsp:Transcript_65386/g.121910  ORF Transcript_65386/g.121910 Transcript_65386/m.121910 type:complete len:254 (+) Transcript_65386:1210-1971(+)
MPLMNWITPARHVSCTNVQPLTASTAEQNWPISMPMLQNPESFPNARARATSSSITTENANEISDEQSSAAMSTRITMIKVTLSTKPSVRTGANAKPTRHIEFKRQFTAMMGFSANARAAACHIIKPRNELRLDKAVCSPICEAEHCMAPKRNDKSCGKKIDIAKVFKNTTTKIGAICVLYSSFSVPLLSEPRSEDEDAVSESSTAATTFASTCTTHVSIASCSVLGARSKVGPACSSKCVAIYPTRILNTNT